MAQVEVEGERTQLRNFGTVTQRNPHLLVVNVFNQKVNNGLGGSGSCLPTESFVKIKSPWPWLLTKTGSP